MKTFPIPSHRLHEIVQSPKCLQIGESAEFETKGTRGLRLDARLDLIDGKFVGLRLFVHAGDREIVTTYEAGLCVAGPRVRGIGYSPLRVLKRYKEHIPEGWHENVIDPNLPDTDLNHNRHVALPDFTPVDVQDFTRRSATRWHIDLEFAEELV